MINNIRTLSIIILFSFLFTSCASFRVVQISKGADAAGRIQDYYAVAENNVIVPEYVINARQEYPTSKDNAWDVFKQRKNLKSQIRKKYFIPNDVGFSISRYFGSVVFTVMSPITYPMFYFSSKTDQSFGNYLNVMVLGEPKAPKLQDEFSNF